MSSAEIMNVKNHPTTRKRQKTPSVQEALNIRFYKIFWRRSPESNRGTRLCRPLHNHSATPPGGHHLFGGLKRQGEALASPEIWSGRRGSNSRPQPWQGCALPTELLPHVYCISLTFLLCFSLNVEGFLVSPHQRRSRIIGTHFSPVKSGLFLS